MFIKIYKKMKKLFVLFFSLLSVFCIAQNTVVIQSSNGSSSSSQDNSYYIQGISSRENIGGVDVSFLTSGDPYGNPYLRRVVFKNYRDYPVTVLYEFTYGHPQGSTPNMKEEGSITLDAKEQKSLSRMYNSARSMKMIVRKLD